MNRISAEPSGFDLPFLDGLLSRFEDPMFMIIGLLILAAWLLRGMTKRRRYRFWKRAQRLNQGSEPRNMTDPKTQMDAISRIKFQKRRLMNKEEFAVYRVLDTTVAAINSGYRVMAQTSLGELIQPQMTSSTETARREAHASINSKRLDFAIIDRSGLLALAVEVQGSGHYIGSTTFMRDAVKREALRRAGVEMLEVMPNWDAQELAASVSRALTMTTMPKSRPGRVSGASSRVS